MLGERLGSYTVTRRIGAGGMGEVFEARHEVLDNRVAIKVLLPALSRDEDAIKRFFNEAKAATRIRHPGIVQIFDFGTHSDGSAYFVMEMLDGDSLAGRLRAGWRASTAEQVAIGRQLADILGAAHGAGIVHRDLKPDNIFLCPDSAVAGGLRVKVLDFGIAKLADNASDPISVKTRSGAVMGTPYYMSPEQCRGSGEVDHRADIYALGCVLFEMATSRPPFTGTGLGEILGAHQFVAPPQVRSLNPGVPPPLEKLIHHTLGKQPEERPQSMKQVATTLDAMARTSGAAPASESAPAVALDSTLPAGVMATPTPTAPTAPPAPTAPTAGTAMPTPASASSPTPGPTTTMGGSAGQVSRRGASPPRRITLMLAGAAVLAVGATTALLLSRRTPRQPATRPATVRADAAVAGTVNPPAPAMVASPTPTPPEPNPWIAITPPATPVTLGIASDQAGDSVLGLRPSRGVTSPARAYQIQQHEVTWGELEPWLRTHPQPDLQRPAGSDDRLPVTGLTWQGAREYCATLGAALPTEAEWEFAARGTARRPYPWGAEPIDLQRTHAFAGAGARPVLAMTSDQDRSPDGVHDLAGNVREWTTDLWREDLPGSDESWVQDGDTSYRAVRGLPLASRLGKRQTLPVEGAAHRAALCATGPCVAATADELATIGFRCARGAR
ncbi:MAG: protein kinase [Deltaproteobacteria bacterium]|nr:protein kinase [Deltaproteobacteria bacterium]